MPPGAGGPPGYGPPPGMGPPAGPQPPKSGPSFVVIGLIALVVLVMTGLGGCLVCVFVAKGKSGSTASSGPSGNAPDPKVAVESGQSTWITSERPYVKFLSPPGWSRHINGEWGVFKSPDQDAVFAFTTFNQPGESTRRLSAAASVLGVTNVGWGSQRSELVGRDNFPARVGDGLCNFRGPNGYIWYATVNAGTADQILLIYAVTANGDKRDKEAAQFAIRSLQRR